MLDHEGADVRTFGPGLGKQHGSEGLERWRRCCGTLVERSRDLVEIAADGAEFRDRRAHRERLRCRQGRQVAKMGSRQHRQVRGSCDVARSGALCQQLPICRMQSHVDASGAWGARRLSVDGHLWVRGEIEMPSSNRFSTADSLRC